MSRRTRPWERAGLSLVLALAACSDDSVAEGGASDSDSDGTSEGMAEGNADPGESPPPAEGEPESCDAGDAAWVVRALTFIQGRKPEGQREVQLYVQLLEQLREAGVQDPRRLVATGLAGGDWYYDRWEGFFYEQLKVNKSEVKLNRGCYALTTAAAYSPQLATFIRDNPALGSDFGSSFTMRDVTISSLLLDDLSPIYRADLFARMAAPLTGANVSAEDIDVMRRTNYGEIFEDAYLGRSSGCLECHNSADSVTFNPDPQLNHHWALDGLFERSIYGADEGRPEDEFYAAFRWAGFVDQGATRPWGMGSDCGVFSSGHEGDLLGVPGYLGGELPEAPQLFDVEPLLREGFASLVSQGLELGPDSEVEPAQAIAYLTAANIVNAVWREAQGAPLVLAHRFPRNSAQRDILLELSEDLIASSYSLRGLLADVVTHPTFNQAPPASCGASSAYHLDPIFYPFSIDTSDATAQGNGVGDLVHRHTSWVLMDAASQAMWWDRPQRFGPPGNFFDQPPAQLSFLSALGIFVKDAQPASRNVGFYNLLYWEERYGAGLDPGLEGECTGPLGQDCAAQPWLEQLVETAQFAEFGVEEVMRAIKDRLLLDPVIEQGERPLLEALTGLNLDDPAAAVEGEVLLLGARRYAGLLMTTPQYLLDGVPPPTRAWSERVPLYVSGTGIRDLCEVAMTRVLYGTGFGHSCDGQGVTLE